MGSVDEFMERVLFVHAHPDDETISTGGTIATLVDAGAAVTVVTCTRGELGEVVPPELQHLRSDALGEYRLGELARALHVLGVTDSHVLGADGAATEGRRYRDSGMQWGESGAEPLPPMDAENPKGETLTSASLDHVVNDLAAIIERVQPTAIISYDENGGYGHPDHIRAHDAAVTAAYFYGIPFFEIVPEGRESPDDLTVDVSTVLGRKKKALRAYRTQLTVDGDTIVHSGGQVEPIRSVEVFRRITVHYGPVLDWNRLGLVTKATTSLIALAMGAVAGAVGTANHHIGAAIFSLLIAGGLLLGLRLLFRTRTVALFAAMGLLFAVGLFSLKSPGGSVLIQADIVGYVWTYGLPVIALLVLAWPSIRRSDRDTMKKTNDPEKVVDAS